MKKKPTLEEIETVLGYTAADAAAYRKEHFAVKIEPRVPSPYSESELVLEITTNGRQWQGIGLTKEEAEKVWMALGRFLGKGN